MVRGLVIRSAFVVLGTVPLMVLIYALDASPGVAWMAVLLYTLAVSSYLAHYCVKHADEIPTRSARR